MSAQMTPDNAWVLGASLSAAIAAGPAYLASRRARKAESTAHAEHEHEITRDAFAELTGSVIGRLDEMHATLSDLREWQAAHTTEHAVARIVSPYEVRKGK